jgi:nicotinamidase-related amidase
MTMTQKKKGTVAGTPSDIGAEREYERLMTARRDEMLHRVEEGMREWERTRTYKVPEWLYGPPKGKLFRVECEDVPDFGDSSYLEFDSGRTALVMIDWQIDFCGEHGYVDVMGYPLENTAGALPAAHRALEAARDAGMTVVHAREGHLPDLSDAPYNKILRSKIIGKDNVGIGEQPEGGMGRLLVRGSPSWGIVQEVEPIEGEVLIDKAGKGVLGTSNMMMVLENLGITHVVITGITTDVCVDTFMTQANDLGYWCLLLKDATGATDKGNYEAAIKQAKMQGGVFGWISDSERFAAGLEEGGLISGRTGER